jgi:uncharacterized protein (TIGR02266 family)
MYDRAALILDAESHPLGELSLTMISLGLRPLYATEMDELVLLSREYQSQIGAILVPTEVLAERLPELRKHILEPLDLSLRALVPVGSAPDPELADTLREQGVRFCLPHQPEPHELRYVISNAMSHEGREDTRRDPRVPCQLPVSVESEQRTVEGSLTNLSIGGVFVAMANPFPEGAEVRLQLVFGVHTASVAARVCWRVETAASGMGVAFVDLDDTTREALEGFVEERVRRIRF